MKIIDLLNKIAKGEEVPKKFKDNYHTYELIKYPCCGVEVTNYKDEDGDYLFGSEYELILMLNDEIEEEKEISKMIINEEFLFSNSHSGNMRKEDRRLLDSNFKEISNKINGLIDVINDMRDKEC